MITIDYDLFGTGWARCSIALDGKRIEITGSYLSDCLGGLAGAAVQLLGGAISVRTAFDEEPGEYRWIIDAKDGRCGFGSCFFLTCGETSQTQMARCCSTGAAV